MVNITIATILLFSLIAIKVAIDYRQWLNKRDLVNKKSMIAHGKEWALMAIGFIPSIYFFTKASAFIWPVASLLSASMCAFVIWNLFDGVFNVIRGFKWFFRGSGEATAANTDKFLNSLPLWLAIVIKVGGLVFLLYSYLNNLS